MSIKDDIFDILLPITAAIIVLAIIIAAILFPVSRQRWSYVENCVEQGGYKIPINWAFDDCELRRIVDIDE